MTIQKYLASLVVVVIVVLSFYFEYTDPSELETSPPINESTQKIESIAAEADYVEVEDSTGTEYQYDLNTGNVLPTPLKGRRSL